jgi:hypothetical protein
MFARDAGARAMNSVARRRPFDAYRFWFIRSSLAGRQRAAHSPTSKSDFDTVPFRVRF